MIVMVVCSTFSVFAKDYKVNTLISIHEKATVETEKFIYRDFSYAEEKITFTSIENQTLSKTAVSANILLFDSNQKNIGFMTYCSDKDLDSDYYGFKLSSKGSHEFEMKVLKKYFVEGKTAKNIAYIAIMDENKYCHIGGYDKYKGLTIKEITEGETADIQNSSNTFDTVFGFIFKFFTGIGFPILIGIVLYFLYGAFLNLLHKRMYARKSIFCYIPILNFYISAKLTFGRIISKIYIVILISLFVLGYVFDIHVLYIIAIVLFLLIFLMNMMKLITRNYSFLVLEPAMKNDSFNHAFTASSSSSEDSTSFEKEFTHTSVSSEKEELEEDPPISIGTGGHREKDEFEDVFQAEDNSNGIFDDEEESDLTKLFK